jgi:hypothetical protein
VAFDNPGNGTWTYYLQGRGGGGFNGNASYASRAITVISKKK